MKYEGGYKMLVSAKRKHDKTFRGQCSVSSFNINNLEWIKSILKACEEAGNHQ